MNSLNTPQIKDFQSNNLSKETTLIKLQNKTMQVLLTNYGARIVSIIVPDKDGNRVDVNLGHLTLKEYQKEKANYYGAVIGRVCGRIRKAQFSVGKENYKLPANEGKNMLHGGVEGFHTRVFSVEKQTDTQVILSYFSPDGEEGFPGNLTLTVTYELTPKNELKITYTAIANQTTPFNVTNHAFFNLNGEGNGDVLQHQLQIFADRYTSISADLLPTGKFNTVEQTAFDFTQPKTIGRDINLEDDQLKYGNGYDHTFVLKDAFTAEMLHAARVKGEETGIVMNCYTNQPGVHLYTGNFMDDVFSLKTGKSDTRRAAFCLETQHFSDAMSYNHFPSIVLEPHKSFNSQTIFAFSIA